MGFDPNERDTVQRSGAGCDASDTNITKGGLLKRGSSLSHSWHLDANNVREAWKYSTGSGMCIQIIDSGSSKDQYNLNGGFNEGAYGGASPFADALRATRPVCFRVRWTARTTTAVTVRQWRVLPLEKCGNCHSGSLVEFATVMQREGTDRNALSYARSGNSPRYIGGSSAATATAAGIAALVRARYPN